GAAVVLWGLGASLGFPVTISAAGGVCGVAYDGSRKADGLYTQPLLRGVLGRVVGVGVVA
ncbi:hypothetical protein ACWFRT_29780, partial [Streptomyces anulatus]